MRFLLTFYGLEIILFFVIGLIVLVGIKAKIPFYRHLFFNTAAIFTALLIFELILTTRNKPQSKIDYSDQYYTTNAELGYGVKNTPFSMNATKSWISSGEEIYDVTYSFADGRRVTPDSDPTSQQYSLFLGGSFTFGEGINDTETLPYYYNQHYSQKRKIRNYGFHGYGTHQVYTNAKNQIANDTALLAAEKATWIRVGSLISDTE